MASDCKLRQVVDVFAMRKLKVLVIGAFFYMASTSLGFTASYDIFRMATGGYGGIYSPAGIALCKLLYKDTKDDEQYRCRVDATWGSIANLAMLKSGDAEMAIIQSDWHYHAYKGTGFFAYHDRRVKDLRSVVSLHGESFTVITRKKRKEGEVKIDTFDDLNNPKLRVAIGHRASGVRATLDLLLASKGWLNNPNNKWGRYPFLDFDTGIYKLARMLCSNDKGALDAFVYAAGNPNGVLKDANEACESSGGIKIIPISEKDIEKLIREHPYYYRTVIPAYTYSGHSEDVPTFGVRATLVARESFEPAIVEAMVKALDTHFREFQSRHPVLKSLTKEQVFTREDLLSPLHPGVKEYYRKLDAQRAKYLGNDKEKNENNSSSNKDKSADKNNTEIQDGE